MLDAEHLGDDAELYALGSLGDLARARAERHVLACSECAKRVGDAEATVLRLIEAEADAPALLRGRRPSFAAPRPSWIVAAAAAFVFGLLPWVISSLHDRSNAGAAASGQAAVTAMLAGHFAHAPFVARAQNAPPAKVIYAREGGWIYVIAGAGPDPLDIVVSHSGRSTAVGRLPSSSGVRSTFIALPGRVDEVVLRDRGVVIESAHTI